MEPLKLTEPHHMFHGTLLGFRGTPVEEHCTNTLFHAFLAKNPLVFQLDRQEQYKRGNILIYGVEWNKDDDDGEKVLFKTADELQIDLKGNELQRVHRLGQTRRNNENPHPLIARFVSYRVTQKDAYPYFVR